MLSWISIRWRITLFHIITMLGIGALLTIGMFAVFGIAAANFVEAAARSRANEAARIVEHGGTLTESDLATLNRDNVFIIGIDADGNVVSQIGSGFAVGATVPPAVWSETASTGQASSTGERSLFQRWDDQADYIHVEPVVAGNTAIRYVAAGVNYDQVGQSQYQWVTFAFVGFGILAFILITIGSIWLVRYSLAPVKSIAESAAGISDADLSQRLPVRSSRDELGHLAMTFNALLDRLEAAFRDREETLAHQRRFVADASHELRTPLTSILGYTRMLRQWGLGNPDASAEAVARMEAEAIRMQSLVEGLLHLARRDEAGELDMRNEDLGEIVIDVVSDVMAGTEVAIGITLQMPEEPVVVAIDKVAIRQVLGILLDNARKFSEPGSTVTVGLEKGGTWAAITIADTGSGIAPEHLPHIFERFYRADASRTTQGAGLGLAIAKGIVERHGGKIDVESEPGQGATFIVRLPLMPVPVGEPPAGSRVDRTGVPS
jgi:signal transduction histidine kinase